MEVTGVKIFPVSNRRVKAYASIVLDDCFVVKDVKVIHGESKLFVAMPSKKMKDGSYRDTVHPLNNTTRQKIEVSVLNAYEKELKKQQTL